MLLHELFRGDSPLVIDVPHAGRHVPDAIALRLTPAARALPDTDWHVERLYAFARSTGATLMCATHARYVVDLNRDPAGTPLYPGADNTELCPTRTFAGEPIYAPGEEPGAAEIDARRATWFAPYHALLAAEVGRVRARHGYAILLDGHSIGSRVPRFFTGRLPDLNLGTSGGASCAPSLQARAAGVLAATTRFSHVVNGRFKGGYITRHYGRPQSGVHALQLEMAQEAYMEERPPYAWDASRAAALQAVLERLVVALAEWRPHAEPSSLNSGSEL
jgi:N-formylglutamate amidohydrolase